MKWLRKTNGNLIAGNWIFGLQAVQDSEDKWFVMSTDPEGDTLDMIAGPFDEEKQAQVARDHYARRLAGDDFTGQQSSIIE